MFDNPINHSLEKIDFSLKRDNSGLFTVTSLMFPEITATGRSLGESDTNLTDKLRNYEPYRTRIIYFW